MELTWTEELSIGNEMIDSGHRNLLEIVERIVRAIESEDCLAFSQAFEMLEYRLRIHYANEERIAQKAKFPYARYKAVQQYFQKELELFKQELLSRKCECCGDAIQHYSDTVKRLVIGHITETCRLMKPFLQDIPRDQSRMVS